MIARAEFHPYIYDTTPKAQVFLKEAGLYAETLRPTGHWWHAFGVASVTSAIDIAATQAGVRFIPAHTILARAGSKLPIQGHMTTIIPDQLFALDYSGSFRAFVLEVDRGTEPLTSQRQRKSLSASIAAYAEAQTADRLRSAYGLKAPVIVLWVFNAKARAEFALEQLAGLPAGIRAAHLVRFDPPHPPGQVANDCYFHQPWTRANSPPVFLDRQ